MVEKEVAEILQKIYDGGVNVGKNHSWGKISKDPEKFLQDTAKYIVKICKAEE